MLVLFYCIPWFCCLFFVQYWLFCCGQCWVFGCRQNGRSYLGILDDAQHSLSLLDIPFTDIDNIVHPKSLSLQVLVLKLMRKSTDGYVICPLLVVQSSWKHTLIVEGASATHPSSVAKVPYLPCCLRKYLDEIK